MSELYLGFFIVGLLLFGAIVAYSVLQQRKGSANNKSDYVDPLYAELEQGKERASNERSEPKASSPSVSKNSAIPKEASEPSLNDHEA